VKIFIGAEVVIQRRYKFKRYIKTIKDEEEWQMRYTKNTQKYTPRQIEEKYWERVSLFISY